jgi:signal transduction histidine kinase
MSLAGNDSWDAAGWPVLVADHQGVISHANSAAIAFFGAPLKNLPARLTELWPSDAPVSWHFLCQPAAPAAKPPPPIRFQTTTGADERLVCSFQRPDKRFILQFLPASPAEGSAATQKQKLDCALQLARTVALDFNNVLTSILGHASLILSKLDQGHPWRASLQEIEKSAAKAAEIANDLGTFSSTEREPRAPAAGNLNSILRRGVDRLRENQNRSSIHFAFQLEKSLYVCKFDESKLQQAFTKILDNALEAVPDEGRITISTRNLELTEPTQDRSVRLSPGPYVCVEFKDTGTGIPDTVLPKVFEPFFTTKGSNHRGLGLAWVYGIVTNHGGGVAISSQPGSGTSVRVYLPAEKRQLCDSGMSSPTDLAGDQTILLVDDEELLLTMGQTVLSSFGYRVLVANNAVKALELLQNPFPRIDLIITDLVMPGLSGNELAERARVISPTTRILRTSGYVWNSSKEGQPNYLQKPFTSQELLRKVKETLG